MILNLRSLQNAQGAGRKSEQAHCKLLEDIKVHNDRIFWLDLIKATMLRFIK